MRRAFSHPLIQMVILMAAYFALALPFQLAALVVAGTNPLRTVGGMVFVTTGLAVIALGVVVLARKVVERRSYAEIGLPRRNALRDLLVGFGLGAVLLSVVLGIMAVAGWYRVDGVSVRWTHLLGMLVVMLMVGFGEEIVARGFILRLTERFAGTWLALVVSAAVFGFLHSANPGATWFSGLAITVEAGILLGAAFLLTRSLWMPIGLHASWNFFQGSIYGATVSGADIANTPLLRPTIEGPTLWTGGEFGPEAGLVALIVGTVAGLAMMAMVVRRGRIYTPGWLAGLTDGRGSSSTSPDRLLPDETRETGVPAATEPSSADPGAAEPGATDPGALR